MYWDREVLGDRHCGPMGVDKVCGRVIGHVGENKG